MTADSTVISLVKAHNVGLDATLADNTPELHRSF
jgi:hypothetical protein